MKFTILKALMLKNVGSILHQNGQAFIETIVILPLLILLISFFLILIYRSSTFAWIDYHLHQASECEQSTIVQSDEYLKYRRSRRSNRADMGNQNLESSSIPNRLNNNCLLKARHNIAEIAPWALVSVTKHKPNQTYKVKFQWLKNTTLTTVVERQSSK